MASAMAEAKAELWVFARGEALAPLRGPEREVWLDCWREEEMGLLLAGASALSSDMEKIESEPLTGNLMEVTMEEALASGWAWKSAMGLALTREAV